MEKQRDKGVRRKELILSKKYEQNSCYITVYLKNIFQPIQRRGSHEIIMSFVTKFLILCSQIGVSTRPYTAKGSEHIIRPKQTSNILTAIIKIFSLFEMWPFASYGKVTYLWFSEIWSWLNYRNMENTPIGVNLN